MSGLDAGARVVVEDCQAELHRKMQRAENRPRVSKGAIGVSRGKPAPMLETLRHVSRLAERHMLLDSLRETQRREALAGRLAPERIDLEDLPRIAGLQHQGLSASKEVIPRPRLKWVEQARKFAAAIAIAKMRRTEPEEAAKYDVLHREGSAKVQEAKRRSDIAGKAEDREIRRLKAIFLSRYFRVPEPNLLSLGFWSLSELRNIGRIMAEALTEAPEIEPAWFPDGWRESMAFFGQEKVNNDG